MKLISAVGTEQVRWSAEASRLKEREPVVLGEALESSAVLAYGGPFTLFSLSPLSFSVSTPTFL